jgi:hypothetical protein
MPEPDTRTRCADPLRDPPHDPPHDPHREPARTLSRAARNRTGGVR